MRGRVVADVDKTGTFLIGTTDESKTCQGKTGYIATDAGIGEGYNTGNMTCTEGTGYNILV